MESLGQQLSQVFADLGKINQLGDVQKQAIEHNRDLYQLLATPGFGSDPKVRQGIVADIATARTALDGFTASYAYDMTGSYDLVWKAAVVLSLIAAAVSCGVREKALTPSISGLP